ncbi:MAG: response regulator transcription factor [Elusimicrobia bacterium]|nr:response regulator transcription factor [Elusimicrobiota bacterium]
MAPAKQGSILVVDDDPFIIDIVSKALGDEGFEVHAAKSVFQARGSLERVQPCLVVLDRRLPGGDGVELCKEIRSNPRFAALPVLFLTSKRSVADKLVGLSVGADDYLPKPFSPDELVLRVKAILRRTRAGLEPATRLRSGDVELDADARKATLRGKDLRLTPREFELLSAFLEGRGRALSRGFLLERIWGAESLTVTPHVLEVLVSTLRAKLGGACKQLVNVLNHGYRWEDPG